MREFWRDGVASMYVHFRRGLFGAAIILAALPALAQPPAKPPTALPPTKPPVTATPAIPPLSPPQQAAVLLGRWETCIDLAAQFLAYSALGARKSVANVERKCAHFEAQIRPVLSQSLRDMMYGSSDSQVYEQTEVAVGSLRRHIHARATSAVARTRTK